jgi:hypothetical protein
LLERRNKLSLSFLPVVGFLKCFPGLVAYSPGWSGTRIWLPLYCNTSTTRGLVCLTKKERFLFFPVSVFFSAFGIWQVKSYFKRLPTHELGEGALFEAHKAFELKGSSSGS